MNSRTYPPKNTTVPTAAVLTHVVHLLTYLLHLRTYDTVPTTIPTARAPTIPTPVQYVLRTAIRTYYTADIRTYIYWKKMCCCRRDRYILHLHSVRRHCTYWCTYCMYLLFMHARILKKTTSDERTYPSYVLLQLMLKVHTYCTKLLYLLYVPTTVVRTAGDGCIHLLLYVLPVHIASTYWWRTYVKKEKPRPKNKKLSRDTIRLLAQSTPKRGRNRAKSIAQW